MREYCGCGHERKEHDRVYEWAPKQTYCSGFSVAYDFDSEGEPSSRRNVNCSCTDFYAADEWQLQEWRECGNLPS